MATLKQALQQSGRINENDLEKGLFDYIIALKHEFIRLNIKQIDDHQDSKGKLLQNNDPAYSGIYTKATEEIATAINPKPLTSKRAGDPYNFVWGGDFMNGFYLYQKNNQIVLGSTGTGTGLKEEFFKGYENLFGLTEENLREVVKSKLLPLFIRNIRNTLNI